jgi:hypothetical protein
MDERFWIDKEAAYDKERAELEVIIEARKARL